VCIGLVRQEHHQTGRDGDYSTADRR